MALQFPAAADYGQLPNGAFTPDIWEPTLLVNFYEEAVAPNIVNMDYEGSIRKYGDIVHIRNEPEIEARDYSKGQALVHQVVEDAEVQLVIDKGVYYCVPVDDVDRRQSDVGWVEALQRNAVKQFKRKVDSKLLGSVYADVAAANILDDRVVSPNNIPEVMIEAGVVLDEAFVPRDNRWMVIPYWWVGHIKLNERFSDANAMGDGKSILRGGPIGKFDDFTLYPSPWLPVVSSKTQVTFGRTSAITMAMQFVKTETLRNQWTFGDIIRGLQVWGTKVVRPDHIGKVGVQKG